MITPVGFNIIQQNGTKNTTGAPGRQIEWIVLHYTAGTRSNQGTARSIANFFSTTASASADFVVDDVEVVQYNGDIENRYCWAVGGGRYPGKTCSVSAEYYGKCRNRNSISVELCSSKTSWKTLDATDTDWFFSPAVIKNGIQLTAYLAERFNIPADHIIMHAQVNGKCCPNPWCVSEGRLSQYRAFVAAVSQYRRDAYHNASPAGEQADEPVAQEPFFVKILVDSLRIRTGPGTAYPPTGKYVNKGKAYTIVEEAGEFGRLKSGAGWISLDSRYVERIDREAVEELLNACV